MREERGRDSETGDAVRENPLVLKLVRLHESHTHTHTHTGCAYANAIKYSGREGTSATEGAALADADELNREHCITITAGRGGGELCVCVCVYVCVCVCVCVCVWGGHMQEKGIFEGKNNESGEGREEGWRNKGVQHRKKKETNVCVNVKTERFSHKQGKAAPQLTNIAKPVPFRKGDE